MLGLARCAVAIHSITDRIENRRLRGFRNEIAEPLRRGIEPFEKESVNRGVARGKLRGVQIPPLIESVVEGMADVIVMQLPGAMYYVAVGTDGHDVGRAVGKPESCSGE